MSSFFALHDPRIIAKFLHECFAHRSMLLEDVLGVPQHEWQSFISSYRCHSVDEHECTKNNLIICLFVCFYVSDQNIGQMVMVGPTTLKLMNE